jgi:phosphoadenosine phosphosulfate reductase
MWALIVKKRMPPLRHIRYCCEALKERGGEDRFVATGVRWAESTKRKTRSSLEIVTKKQENKIILNADNHEHRRQFETCTTKGRRTLNPIIDWSDDEVWELLNHYNCLSNPLYKCGYNRVGCIGCPNSTGIRRRAEFAKYPKYKALYIHTFDKMIAERRKDGLSIEGWETGEKAFEWWGEEMPKVNPYKLDGQLDLWSIEGSKKQ